jgi:WD40 repeat protein
MPQTNADDPLRTTDAQPSAAPPNRDVATDTAPAAPVINERTGTYFSGTAAEPTDIAASVAVPGYEIEGTLGRGGMGVVYKARHLALKRTVALKMVLAGGHAGPGELARFRLEAEAVARLQHPNIVQIHEVGEAGGHPYCALEFVEGGSLAAKLDGKPLPALEAAQLVTALARAMQLAHSRNVVHRDLKPANVLLTADGTPKITDFGLARQLDSDSGATQAGAVMGTPSYMAPEQASGHAHEAGPAADIYALGAILYECLSGRPPFKGKTVVETLDQVRTQEPARLSGSVPPDLETICLKCLRKEPERRYASAAELADDLGHYQRGEPIQARPVGRLERAGKWVKRNPVLTVAAATVLAVTVLGVAGVVWKYLDAEEQRGIAENRREEAEKQTGIAQDNEKKAKRANDDLTHQLGVSSMVLANAAYDNGDFNLAAERLDKVPEEQRGWEWRYLNRQLHGGILTLHGHRAAVTSVAFSPDGTRIVTGGGNQGEPFEAKVWDARTGVLQFDLKGLPPTVPGLNTPVVCVAFSPDSKRIVTAGGDKTARVWDALTGALQLELKEQAADEEVTCAAFSPDGTQIATTFRAGDAAIVRLWDARTGKALLDWKAHEYYVRRLAFSPDGTRLLTGGFDQAVRVWDAQKGTLLLDAKGMMSPDSSVALSPDGKRIVAGRSDGTARVIDAQTGTVLLELKGRPILGNTVFSSMGVLTVAFSPDGSRVVTGGTPGDGTGVASVWDARTGAELLELKGHTGAVMSVAFSPDGERIITGSEDRTAKVWDARTGTPRLDLDASQGGAACAAFGPDGAWIVTGGLIVTRGGSGKAMVWDARTGLPKFALKGIKGAVLSVAISKDGTRIVTGGGTATFGEATVWDAQTGAPLAELKGLNEAVYSVAFSPDGTGILTGGGHASHGGTELKMWDATTGTVLLDLTQKPGRGSAPGERGASMAFSPDGQWFVTGGMHTVDSPPTEVKVRDARTGTVKVVMKGTKSPVLGVALSKDGTRIAAGSSNNRATIWDAETGAVLVELKGHTGNVLSVAFSPDGKRVITGSGDKTVRVWDARTGTTLAELKGHTGGVTSVSFSADGTRILSAGGLGGRPGEVFVWDTRIGKEPPDEEEIAYRRLHTQPNPSRYRSGYLAARAAKDDFAAAFYLNLIPPDQRKELEAKGATEKKPMK